LQEYSFEMTLERALLAARELDAILWLQNERLYELLRHRMRWRRQLRVAGMVIAVFGLLLASTGAVFAPQRLRLAFVVAVVLFVLFVAIFWRAELLEQAMRRATRRLVANRARRAMDSVLRKAPYTIRYTIESDSIGIHASELGIAAQVPFKRMRHVVVASSVVCAFEGPYRQRPLRVLYVPGPAELDLLETVLSAHQSEVVRLP
jgi:hypothetical protein